MTDPEPIPGDEMYSPEFVAAIKKQDRVFLVCMWFIFLAMVLTIGALEFLR